MAANPPPPALAPPAVPAAPRRSPFLAALRLALIVLATAALLVLGGLGAVAIYALALERPYPMAGRILEVVERPAPEGDGSWRNEHRLGERLLSRRLGDGTALLGVARRAGGPNGDLLELRDAAGRVLARVGAPAGLASDPAARAIEVADLEGRLLPRFALARTRTASDRSQELYLGREDGGWVAVRRVTRREQFGGLLGERLLGGTALTAPGGDGALDQVVFSSREGGLLELWPQDSTVGFLEPPPGAWARVFRPEVAEPVLTVKVEARFDPRPWAGSSWRYLLVDGHGELAEVGIEPLRLLHRGRTRYHYLVDLDGNGRLDAGRETVHTVVVTDHGDEPQTGRSRGRTIDFLPGTAPLDDLEALRLGEEVEAWLADALGKGLGRDSELGFVEQARDEALALLDPNPFAVAATLGLVDGLRPASSWVALGRATARSWVGVLGEALGRPLEAAGAGAVAASERSFARAPALAGLPLVGAAPMPPASVELLAHAEDLLRTVGPAVWPGLGADLPPVIVVGAASEWCLRHPSPPEGFAWQGRDPTLDTDVFARPRTLPADAQLALEVAGVPTVVVGEPQATQLAPTRWTLAYARQAFHAWQLGHGEAARLERLGLASPERWQFDHPFPYGEPAVGQAMALLGVALERGTASAEAAPCPHAVRVALAAAEALEALLAPGDLAYLRFVEWKQGVGRHVELEVARAAAAAGLRPPGESSSDAYRDAGLAILGGMRERLRGLGPGQLNRESFQASGAGLAQLLDGCAPGWKERYLDPDGTLEGWLGEAVGAASADLVGPPPPPAGSEPPAAAAPP